MADGGLSAQYLSSNPDVVAKEAPGDSISSLAWSPVQDVIAAGSWDKSIYIWEVNGQDMLARTSYVLQAPVLSCSFSSDGLHLISGGCDHKVTMRDLQAQQTIELGHHEEPVRFVSALEELKLVVSGSWDKTLCFWSPQQSKPVLSVPLPERVFAMDVKYPLMVVGCADRQVLTYDLAQGLKTQLNSTNSMFSGLKMQTRSVSCFPDRTGFVLGGIEGRCSVKGLDDQSKTFTFKCHQTQGSISAVNALDFHPAKPSTLASVGGDGSFIFWETTQRKLLRKFDASSMSLTAGKFNSTGSLFAYAVSYDWSKGHEAYHENLPRQVVVHSCKEDEVACKTSES
ncbi:Poly(A)+ RNA export protein [Durusdinium trenchii]|uniref:Poly(A)+ RNA export protein n=1 Tax=Durusdinium trenchii TaxID=1381693 RepID=A0ABP0HPK3_9DINO